MMYLLTPRRAVISARGSSETFTIANIRSIEVKEDRTTLGDVIFIDRDVSSMLEPARNVKDGFIGIADAEAVAREMRRLQAAAS
jgi:hypothetical protein